MYKKCVLFALLMTAFSGGAFANIPSTAYVQEYVKENLPPATSSDLGGVKIGTNISVSDGEISVETATPSKLGVAKVGQIPSGSATSETYATIWVE